jgi:hypothetical protein
MAFAEIYKRQVVLLIRVLPRVTEEECFALKGGAATVIDKGQIVYSASIEAIRRHGADPRSRERSRGMGRALTLLRRDVAPVCPCQPQAVHAAPVPRRSRLTCR